MLMRNSVIGERRSSLAAALLTATLLVATLLVATLAARGGHEITYYPSFYPQEIRLEPLDPEAAAKEFVSATDPLHAYIGAAPRFAGPAPAHLKTVESLASLVVLDFNPGSARMQSREARCAVAAQGLAALRRQPDLVEHRYPVTPFHADYFNHIDRIADPKPAAGSAGGTAAPVTYRPADPGAALALAPDTPVHPTDWDARLDEVPLEALLAKAGAGYSAWPMLPWAKEGWFQAYHLLRAAVADGEDQNLADEIYERLTQADARDATERVNLERNLISALTRGCGRAVVGYRLRQEYYNDDFSNGIENIVVDSQSGFGTPLFFRVTKLKDFPWNGWLRVGVGAAPKAAWNPVAGFTDLPGRLVWSAVGDDAFLPIPYNSRWVANRTELAVDPDSRLRQSIRVPADAVMPAPGSGRLAPLGAGHAATAKVTYRVLASAFQDGSEADLADLLYPYALAFRWGAEPDGAVFDPDVAAATRPMRERLKGVRMIRLEESTLTIADKTFAYRQPIVEVYLDDLSTGEEDRALVAPPWSSVPWHLLALMEAAVERGIAAFSRREAERRRLPWLDLVRDDAQRARMRELVGEFARQGYRPAALEGFVTPDAAKARWERLARFIDEHGHLLVTSGPYRLRSTSPQAIVFDVVRDFTYPIGLGTFDPYSYPPRAVITAVERAGSRITVAADVEFAVKAQRSRRQTRMALKRDTLRETYPIRPLTRYAIVGADGTVAAAGSGRWEASGLFAIALPAKLPPGRHAFFTAIFLDGNTVRPAIGRIDIQGD